MANEQVKRLALVVFVLALATLACGETVPLAPTPTATSEPPSASTATPEPTATPTPTDTPTPTNTRTLHPTSTPHPANTPQPTATHTPLPTNTPKPRPTQTATPVAAAATATPVAAASTAAPSSAVVATFLVDARQTQSDLMEIKNWFDQLAGGQTVLCSTVYAHSIHVPVSMAPGQVPELGPAWNEYQVSIADGQLCLQWLIDFCNAGGGNIGEGTFWERRELSSAALSKSEHVVQALEAIP